MCIRDRQYRGGHSECGWVVTKLQATREMWITARMRPAMAKTPSAEPVSYTHLDVYKRQGYGRFNEPFIKDFDRMFKSQVVLWGVPVLASESEQRSLVPVRLCGVGILR